jgi:glycosyltransferase involved in cell wall biosynthesis
MKILALAPFPPRRDATHGGGRVVGELLLRLAERHSVALVCLRGTDDPPLDNGIAERIAPFEEIARPSHAPSRWAQRARRVSALARGRPLWEVDCAVPALATRVAEVALSWKPDAVQVYWQVMAQYADAVDPITPLVLIAPEVASVRAPDELQGISARLDAALWRRVERRALGAVDATVVFAEEDRADLLALVPDSRVEVIPFAVEPPEAPLDPLGSDDLVLFVGNFRHTPNVDAARRLAQDILPLVWAERRTARLRLAGAQPPTEIRALAADRVEVAADVPDMAQELQRAAVVALPLRLGGGMRVKALEALGAGKAVVASPLALRGTNLVDGEHVLTCSTDEQFASAIVSLLQRPDRRRVLGENARSWAEVNSRWEPRIRMHEDLLQSLS